MHCRWLLLVTVIGVAASGCATKRYGRLTEVSDLENKEYTCHDIRLEKAKVRAFQDQVAKGAQIDWRSVAGFLGDYGIGNAMERSDAEASARRRMEQLDKISGEKHCEGEEHSLLRSFFRLMGR